MSSRGWVERVLDRKSMWRRAVELEEGGNFKEAAKYYTEEAKRHEGKNEAMSGLCFLSAAKCLLKAGEREKAIKLFRVAGNHYMKYAETILPTSPRSAAWGYRMAAKCFSLANEHGLSRELLRIAKLIEEKLEGEEKKEKRIFRVYRPRKGGC